MTTADAWASGMKILRSNLNKKELLEIENQDLTVQALVQSVTAFQKRHNQQRTAKLFAKLDQQISRIERFGEAINNLVSCNPTPAALLWGSIRVVFKVRDSL